MNKNYKLLIGIGALAVLYFAFKKKGTTTKSTSTDKAESSTIKSAKVEGGTMSIDEKELLDNVKRKSEIKAGDSPKVIAIKKFAVDVFSNQPKSPEEFLARASKAGLSQADLQSPEAQKIMNPFASFEGISDDDFYKMDAKRKEIGGLFKRSSENFKRLEDFAKANNIDIDKYIDAVRKMSWKGQSRIKPTSVSGISMVQRPRNYGTAQRPTRALTPISITPSFAGFMDFDGNDDVMADML